MTVSRFVSGLVCTTLAGAGGIPTASVATTSQVRHSLDPQHEKICEDAMNHLCGEYSEENKPQFLECVFHHRKELSETCNVKTAWPSNQACSSEESALCQHIHPGEGDINSCLKDNYKSLSSKCVKQYLRDHTAFLCLDDVNRLCRGPKGGMPHVDGKGHHGVIACLADHRAELSDACREHTAGMASILIPRHQKAPSGTAPPTSERNTTTRPPVATIFDALSQGNAHKDSASFVAHVMANAISSSGEGTQVVDAKDVELWLRMAGAGGLVVAGIVLLIGGTWMLVNKGTGQDGDLEEPLIEVVGEPIV